MAVPPVGPTGPMGPRASVTTTISEGMETITVSISGSVRTTVRSGMETTTVSGAGGVETSTTTIVSTGVWMIGEVSGTVTMIDPLSLTRVTTVVCVKNTTGWRSDTNQQPLVEAGLGAVNL